MARPALFANIVGRSVEVMDDFISYGCNLANLEIVVAAYNRICAKLQQSVEFGGPFEMVELMFRTVLIIMFIVSTIRFHLHFGKHRAVTFILNKSVPRRNAVL